MKVMVLSLLATLALGSAALAQPGGPPIPLGAGQPAGMPVYEKLGLDPAQKVKIKALTDKQREETVAIRKKYTDQIMALLTPDQKKKLEEARKMSMGVSRGKPGGGAPGGPPGGAPGGKR